MRDRNTPLTEADIPNLAWEKAGGLIPAIVQDADTLQVLMLGFVSPEALAITLSERRATFHSRSRDRLWQKGETSGNRLDVKAVHADCDQDALLVLAEPAGPTCHRGTRSCFTAEGPTGIGWLAELARIVRERREAAPTTSYSARLLAGGATRIAQKIGEEGVELALAGAGGDRASCIDEAADLIYHLTLLMEAREFSWDDVVKTLRERHASRDQVPRASTA